MNRTQYMNAAQKLLDRLFPYWSWILSISKTRLGDSLAPIARAFSMDTYDDADTESAKNCHNTP